MNPNTARRRWSLMLVLIAGAALSGCSAYALRGRVVEGSTPGIIVLKQNDPRLQGFGLPGARIQATLDPEAMRPIAIPPTITDGQGWFEMPIDQTGAGFLEYEIRLIAHLAGHQTAIDTFKLPGGDRRILIVLAPGDDGPGAPTGHDNILEETLRMRKQLER
jgi:hypothetical protein